MTIVSIFLFGIGIALICLSIEFYRVASKCLEKQGEGRVFVLVRTNVVHYGWVLSRDIKAVSNDMKSVEDHIRVEENKTYSMIQIKSIKEITIVSNPVVIVMRNL